MKINLKPMYLALVCGLIAEAGMAQGLLPAKKAAVPASEQTPPYVLIGNPVAPELNVVNAGGNTRSLLSYKPANDLLVVGFFSTTCAQNQEAWSSLKRLYQDYKGWHATFLAVSVQPNETLEALAQAMSKADMPYSVVRDPEARAARALRVTTTPGVAIIDEWGYLRYRGDLRHVREALDSLIGHEALRIDPEAHDVQGCPIP